MTPTTITIPGIVAHLERFLRPLAATSGAGVEIRQDDHGTTVSACEGRHAATIRTTTAGHLDPVLVDPAVLAGIDPSKPAKLYRTTETGGAVVLANGQLATITITPGTLPQSARDLADVVEGEIASGTTKTVFELDPRHLLAVAEAIVATRAERVTIAIAPRWNVLAAVAETSEVSATFLVAGETFEVARPDTTASDHQDADDPLDFTIGSGRGDSSTTASNKRRKPNTNADYLEGLPF